MLAVVPSPASKDVHPIIELLFEVDAETVLDGCTQGMRGYIWLWSDSGEEIVDSLAITAHIGVIHETQEANDSLSAVKHGAMELEFDIFGMCAAYVRVEMDSIGDLRHESFRKPYPPLPVVVFGHGAKREAPRVRRVVISSGVVALPIHELKTAVAAIGIHIEEIHNAN